MAAGSGHGSIGPPTSHTMTVLEAPCVTWPRQQDRPQASPDHHHSPPTGKTGMSRCPTGPEPSASAYCSPADQPMYPRGHDPPHEKLAGPPLHQRIRAAPYCGAARRRCFMDLAVLGALEHEEATQVLILLGAGFDTLGPAAGTTVPGTCSSSAGRSIRPRPAAKGAGYRRRGQDPPTCVRSRPTWESAASETSSTRLEAGTHRHAQPWSPRAF